MKNFNSIKATIVLSVVLCYITPISAQSDSLTIWVDQVEQTLFAEDDYNCYLYEFMECKEIHKPVYDSFQVVNCYQPDANEVNALLENILWTKDPREYGRLLEIYKRYMHLLLNQFGEVFKNNHYKCDFLKDRRSIASNFEMLLISLEFKKKGWSDLKIYTYYKYESIKKNGKGYDYNKYKEILDTFQYRFILQDFKKLFSYNPQNRLNYTIHYIAPYKTAIHPFIKEDLFKSSLCSHTPPTELMLIEFLYQNLDILTIPDSEVLDYLNSNFGCLTKDGNVNRILFSYAVDTKNKSLLERIIKYEVRKVWKDDFKFVLRRVFDRILSVEGSLPILMEEIIKIGEEDLEFAKNRLSYIPWDYREEAKSYIKHNAPKESKLYQELSRGEKE